MYIYKKWCRFTWMPHQYKKRDQAARHLVIKSVHSYFKTSVFVLIWKKRHNLEMLGA